MLPFIKNYALLRVVVPYSCFWWRYGWNFNFILLLPLLFVVSYFFFSVTLYIIDVILYSVFCCNTVIRHKIIAAIDHNIILINCNSVASLYRKRYTNAAPQFSVIVLRPCWHSQQNSQSLRWSVWRNVAFFISLKRQNTVFSVLAYFLYICWFSWNVNFSFYNKKSTLSLLLFFCLS